MSKSNHSDRPGYIYLMKPENMPYKIGLSGKPTDRALRLSVALPYRPEVLHTIRVTSMAKAEKHFHRYFDEKRLGGEWFDLSEEDVARFREILVWPVGADLEVLKILLGEDRPAFKESAKLGRPRMLPSDKAKDHLMRWPPALWERLTRVAGVRKRSKFVHEAVSAALDKRERELQRAAKAAQDEDPAE